MTDFRSKMITVLVSVLSIVVATSAVGAATHWATLEAQREAQIRAVYQKYEDYENSDLQFTLSRFQTIPREQYAAHRLVDVVDLPSGEVIRDQRVQHFRTQREGGFAVQREIVTYQASWLSLSEERWLAAPAVWHAAWKTPGVEAPSAHPYSLSLEEALGFAAVTEPQFAHSTAMTFYDVTASLGRKSRSYRAAFLWLPAEEAAGLEFNKPAAPTTSHPALIVDAIAKGVSRIAEEQGPRQSLVRSRVSRAGNQIPCECAEVVDGPTKKHLEAVGNQGHISGEHKVYADYTKTCTKTSSCVADLHLENQKFDCIDSGQDDSFWYDHEEVGSDIKMESGEAECRKSFTGGIAIACAVKECFLSTFCGNVSVSVTPPGTVNGTPIGATFTYTPQTGFWKLNTSKRHVCGPFSP